MEVGQLISVKNVDYTVLQVNEAYPHVKRNNPHIAANITVKNQYGALISGRVSVSGNIILF